MNRLYTVVKFFLLLHLIGLGFCRIVEAQEDFYKGKTIRIVLGFGPGGGYDRAARLLAKYMGRYIPGNPEVIVQYMPGAGSLTAANYVYSVAKPDGLALLMAQNNIYLSQLSGQSEVKFDIPNYQWIGSLEKDEMLMFARSDAPFKSISDVVKTKEPIKCGTSGVGSAAYVIARILEETIDAKVEHVMGYPGSPAISLAFEKGEVNCMGTTVSTYFAGEPYLNWIKNGFVRFLVQAGRKRDSRISDTPTIYEVMDEYKTSPLKRRVAEAMLVGGEWARAMMTSPGTPVDRVNLLRVAYDKSTKDPELLAEAKKLKMEIEPTSGIELQSMAKDVMKQSPEAVKQLKVLFVQ